MSVPLATPKPTTARPPMSDEEAVALLVDLVRTPSVSTQERACSELLATRMAALGFETEIDPSGSAVGVRGDLSPSVREIVLLGHIDTVPGDVPVRREGDLFFGRGAVDAKGPLAAFTIAAARATLPPGVRVRVIGATEEESATSKGARFACATYRADACIIGEPSGAEGVTLGYKGRVIAWLDVETSSSHSAGPEQTASEIAFEIWSRVREAAEQLTPGAQRVFDRVQAKLRSMNSSHDGVTDRASLTLGFRLPPGIAPAQIDDLCLRASHSFLGARWSFSGHEVAHVAERSGSVARALTSAIRAEGLKPTPKHKTGTSDMNVVAPIWNCPIAAYGPGDSALDHTPNEHIRISEYLASIRVLTRAIETIAGDL
ncbi:MAG: [LysW]-lysine hydrolase [Phycisphaeraceae bacterium]|nr:[LysW]-lysine hydrolase [Phycisphaeraceae bacterium]